MSDHKSTVADIAEEETEALIDNVKKHGRDDKDRLVAWLSDGPLALRVMAFGGGVAVVFVATTGFLHQASITGFVLNAFLIVFGLMTIVLELNTILCTKNCRKWIETNFKFFTKLFGRGMFYCFTGGLMFTGWAIFPWVVGGYMIFVGGVCILVSVHTQKRLKQFKARLRHSAPKGTSGNDRNFIRATFDKYDRSNTGSVDCDDLDKLARDLGLELSVNELHAAQRVLDVNESGTIEFEDFYKWWISDNNILP